MSNLAIKVEELSKLYRLGEIGTGMLSHDLQRLWAKLRGKDDPFLKVGSENDRSKNDGSQYAWALKDISFEVNAGDTVGIIGKNGAGKSTLLKLLSKVTSPTSGNIKIKGRIASLLEVGTGFHPELTGKENIYLNGAILGMTKKEITARLEEIVEFSGIAKYIDTPVKRYSSGMYVRLAFAVAAHLEPEILIVDEVLAVGDAEFQKKCLGKMKDVSSHGRTVLFVSHNMGAIKSFCTRSVLLANGRLVQVGDTETIVNKYFKNKMARSFVDLSGEDPANRHLSLLSIEILNDVDDGFFWINKELTIRVRGINNFMTGPVNINIFFNSDEGANIFTTCSEPLRLESGEFEAICQIPANFLNDNCYYLDLMVVENGHDARIFIKDAMMLEGKEPPRAEGWMGKFPGYIKPQLPWKINQSTINI
jgi:lipopolysaccharide transport system ATP-binding protein